MDSSLRVESPALLPLEEALASFDDGLEFSDSLLILEAHSPISDAYPNDLFFLVFAERSSTPARLFSPPITFCSSAPSVPEPKPKPRSLIFCDDFVDRPLLDGCWSCRWSSRLWRRSRPGGERLLALGLDSKRRDRADFLPLLVFWDALSWCDERWLDFEWDEDRDESPP